MSTATPPEMGEQKSPATETEDGRSGQVPDDGDSLLAHAMGDPEPEETAPPAPPPPTDQDPPPPPEPKPAPAEEPPAPVEGEPPTPKPDEKPGEKPATGQAAPVKPEEDDVPFPDLPPAEWSKLDREGKRIVSKYRNEGRRLKEQVDGFSAFCRDRNLDSETVQNGLTVIAGLKAGDPNVIPFLEQTLAEVRRVNRIETPTATPVVTYDEFQAALKKLEDDYDDKPLRALGEKLKSKGEASPPPVAPAQPKTDGNGRSAAAAGELTPQEAMDLSIMQFVENEIERLGLQSDPLAYAQELAKEVLTGWRKETGLAGYPPINRQLALVMKAHQARVASAAQPAPAPAPRAPQPIRGSGRARGTAGSGGPSKNESLVSFAMGD
jgi:hypothetical protein